MKQQIKVKLFTPGSVVPKLLHKGDWIDLCAAATVEMKAPHTENSRKKGETRKQMFDHQLIPLGIAMQLPPGYEAIIAPRSSLFKNSGILCTNSIGIIDNSYSGNDDQWMFSAVALKDTVISEGQRICQFRIQLSQKASIIQKIKWLFTTAFEFITVNDLNSSNRGGFGSTGV